MKVQSLGILQNTAAYDGTTMQYKGFWKFNSYDYSGYYLHMKTNLNSTNMWMIEAVGYNYCQSTKVRCAWTFHYWYGTPYNVGLQNLGSYMGFAPTNVYISSDGYIVLVGYSGCWGYCGFMLNGYNTGDGYGQSSISSDQTPQIIASAFSYSNSGVY